MPTTSSHLLVLHRFGNVFQDYLLHCFSRHWGEADWPVVPPHPPFAFLEERSAICFLQPTGTSIHWTPWSFTDNLEWWHSGTGQLPQHLSASYQIPSTCIWTSCLNIPWLNSALLRVSLHCSWLSMGLRSLGFLKASLSREDQGEDANEHLGLFCVLCH